MNDLVIGALSVVGLFVLILSGVHVVFALIVMSLLGAILLLSFERALSLLEQTASSAVNDLVFAIVPLFILMGAFMTNSRGASDLYALMFHLVRKVQGGLAVATVFANAAFAAVTGVSIASATIFSKVAYPQMRARNYAKSLALGTVAGSSVLGMLIPPSVLLILYGILTQVSIGDLFLAGVVPGLLLTVMYSIMIIIRVRRHPELAGGTATPVFEAAEGAGIDRSMPRETVLTGSGAGHPSPTSAGSGPSATAVPVAGRPISSAVDLEGEETESLGRLLLRAGPIGVLFVLVIGGIWGGWFTPTEAGAAGAFGAMLIALATGMRWSGFVNSFRETAMATGAILTLLIAAHLYSRMLALSGIVRWLGDEIAGWVLPSTVIVILFVVMCLALGAILDSSSIILLAVPLFFPVIQLLGIDPLWFGIVIVVAVEVGLITPPFGMIPFAMAGVLGREASVEDVFRASFPFVLTLLVFIALLIAFPPIITWLPEFAR